MHPFQKRITCTVFLFLAMGLLSGASAKNCIVSEYQKSCSQRERAIHRLLKDLDVTSLETVIQGVSEKKYDQDHVIMSLATIDGTLLAQSGLRLPVSWLNLGDTPEGRAISTILDGATLTLASESLIEDKEVTVRITLTRRGHLIVMAMLPSSGEVATNNYDKIHFLRNKATSIDGEDVRPPRFCLWGACRQFLWSCLKEGLIFPLRCLSSIF